MNKKNRAKFFASVAAPLTLMVTGNINIAFADDTGYAPLGIHKGSFYLFPVVEIGVGYDDNVYRLPDENAQVTGAFATGPVSDTAVTGTASITANSDWNRHEINGLASVDLGKYNEQNSEDFGNYAVGGSGRLDIKRGSYATAKIGFRHQNESRTSVDSREVDEFTDTPTVYGAEPTQYNNIYVGAGYSYKPARFGFAADLDYETLDYEDNTNVYGGGVINSDRDRGRTSAKVRLSYEVMPQRSVYVQGGVNSVEYDEPLDQNGIERSSTGYDVTAGVNFDLSNLLLGDVYVGYLEQNYDSETQEDISSNKYGAGLQWFPSRLTSVNLNVDRTVEESTEETVSGYLSTRARVGVTHQLKRHISLSANADHTVNDFQQNVEVEGQKEQESITGFDLGGTLSISRLLYTSLLYRHEYRESDIAIQEYTNNRVLLKLGAHW